MPRAQVRVRINAGAVDHTLIMVYISDFGVGPANTLNYLQIVRGRQYATQGCESSHIALTYWGNLCTRITDLSSQVNQHFGVTVENPDTGPSAIVRVPSSRNLNCPYFAVIQRNFANAVDLSPHIRGRLQELPHR